jgi:hypothetical protein
MFDPHNNGSEPIFGEGVPEAIRSAIKEHTEAHRLHDRIITHAIDSLLDRLPMDEMEALLQVMHGFTSDEDGMVAAARFEGLIQGVYQRRFKKCGCLNNCETLDDLATELEMSQSDEPDEPIDEIKAALEEASKYHVAYLSDDNFTDPRVKCTNCGTIYPSLADRMIKGPDDCHGCHHKSAYGS